MKLGDFDFMGNKGNALKVGDWLKMATGAAMVLATFSLGQRALNTVDKKVQQVDFGINDPVKRPAPVIPGKTRV